MDYVHYAAIDIGSNAVRLLIKRLDNPTKGHFSKVVTMRVPLRLGQDAFTTGEISEKKAHDLKDLIRAYAIVMKLYDIKKSNMRCCATAAMREARNGQKVLDSIKKSTDITIDLIPGTEEAQIVCYSHNQNQPEDSTRNLLYVDVGGGSTEVSYIEDGELRSTKSYPIGTIRMLNGAVDTGVKEELWRDMELLGAGYDTAHHGVIIVGAGGNINKLFQMAGQNEKDGMTMTKTTLRALYDEMKTLSVAERAERYNLKPDRADVIVPAAEIFLMIADALDTESIEVPSTGLADGIIEDIYRRQREFDSKKWL